MAIVTRKPYLGKYLVVQGRHYTLPDSTAEELAGQWIWVDDDGVFKTDKPELGLRTATSLRVFYPTRYQFFATAKLDEAGKEIR